VVGKKGRFETMSLKDKFLEAKEKAKKVIREGDTFNEARESTRSGGFQKAPAGGMRLNTMVVGGYSPRKRRKSRSIPSTKTTRTNMERMLGF
jgi:hypothetical protein